MGVVCGVNGVEASELMMSADAEEHQIVAVIRLSSSLATSDAIAFAGQSYGHTSNAENTHQPWRQIEYC